MASALKVTGIVVGVVLVVGVVVGSITWAVLASRSSSEVPSPPELRTLDWWGHTVIYQIYPRSFMDSDGDGIGDLRGMIYPIEYLTYFTRIKLILKCAPWQCALCPKGQQRFLV